MYKEKKPKILAIIPARGGSKGIARKNIRLLARKPLIAYVIETALKSKYIDKTIVSTEDEEIAYLSRIYGAETLKRPAKLAEDDVTLDIVIYHAVNSIEKQEKVKYDIVVTLQPTSPLLSTKTLDMAISQMIRDDYDTLISVIDETHLYWTIKNGKYSPIYEKRKNRQYLPPIYKETGAIIASKRNYITQKTRIGLKISLFKIPKREDMDIDSFRDWWVVENLLKMMNIVFIVDGDYDIGLGHVYRSIILANKMAFNHNVFFLMNKKKKLGVEKVKEYNYPIITFKDNNEVFKKLKDINPDIIINDILDTNKNYIDRLKNKGYFVVNFEDLGEGSLSADIVVNALYENSNPPKNHYCGYKYVCLREEFYIFPPKEIKKEMKQILITFGGTDPNNLTLRTINAIELLNLKKININVILGLGYKEIDEEILYDHIKKLIKDGYKIDVKKDVKMMAKEIYEADLVITSNGRTIYEVAAIGTPCISIAQNDRESKHLFVHNSRCIEYIGMEYTVSEDDIATVIEKLINNYDLRKEMNAKCLEFNLKKGMNRILRIIYDGYYERKENK